MSMLRGELAAVTLAQTTGSTIAGTWEGKTEGVPVITITIKEENAKLSGSVTFYRIEDDGNGPTVTGKETKELINPKLEGKIFSYQIKGRNDELVSLQMELTGKDEGLIKLRRMINGNTEQVPVKMTRSAEKSAAAASLPSAPAAAKQDKMAQPEALRSI